MEQAVTEFLDRHDTRKLTTAGKPILKTILDGDDKKLTDDIYKKGLNVADIATLIDCDWQLVNLYLLENHDDYVYGTVSKEQPKEIRKNQISYGMPTDATDGQRPTKEPAAPKTKVKPKAKKTGIQDDS